MVDWKNPSVMAAEAGGYPCVFLVCSRLIQPGLYSRLHQRGPRVLWAVYLGTHSHILL